MSSVHIYVIGPLDDLAVTARMKVGIAESVEKRLRALQTGHFDALKIHYRHLLPSRPRAKLVESVTHELLAPAHERGEWFNVTPLSAASAIAEAGEIIDRVVGKYGQDALSWSFSGFWAEAVGLDVLARFRLRDGEI